MAKRNRRTLLWLAGAGVGAYVGYQYVYKPWRAGQVANGNAPLPGGGYYPAPGGGGSLPGPMPGGSLLPQPGNITPIGWSTLGPQYGGVLGACIAKKGGTWSPEKCQARLNELVNAGRVAKAKIAELKAGIPNPAAAGVPVGQTKLLEVQAAIVNDQQQYAAASAAGDAVRAAAWHGALLSHQAEANAIAAHLAASQKPIVDTVAIAAWEGALAGHDTDYFNLTGVRLLSAI